MTEQWLSEGDTVCFGGAEWTVDEVDPQIGFDDIYLERDGTRLFGHVNYNGSSRGLEIHVDSEEVVIR